MASELLKNKAVINSIKEGDVPRVNFDLENTGFELLLPEQDLSEEFLLPEQKLSEEFLLPREEFARGSEKDLGSFIYKPEVQKEIKKLYDQGLSLNEIVDKTKYSRSTVKRVKNILGLETIFEKNKNTVENAIKKLKREKDRNPTLAEMKRETGLNEKTINRYKGNITLSMGQKVGEFKGAGTEASAKMFKEKEVDKPTATNFDGKPGVKFKDKAQEKKYLEILEKKYDYPINSPEIKEINKKLMKDFGINKFSLERINATLAKQKGFEFPKKVYDPGSERDRQRIREKKRAEALKKTSDPSIERQIQKLIKSVDSKALAKDVDVAHRSSLIANANLGSDYLSTSLGIDKKIVNQKLVKPTEQKLGKLYEDQKKLIKGLKSGEVPKDIQKKIEKLNIKISELSDRTDGALQGVLVDEKTLKPYIYGIDYKKVLGAGLVKDKPLKEINKADLDLIKLNLPSQIESAKKFKELGKKKLTAIEELMQPGASLGADPIKMGKVLAEDALKIGGRTIRGAATLGDALISVGKGAGGFGIGAMIEADPIITGGTEGKSFTQAGRDTIIGSLIDLIPGVDLGSLETDALKYADTEEEKIGMQNLIDYKNDYDRLQKDINAFKSYQTVPDFELEGTGIDLAQMQIDLAARYRDLTERAPKVYNPDVARIINELSLDLAEERKDRLEGIYGLIFGSRQMKADPDAFVLDQATDISQAIMGLEPVNKNLQQLENQLSPEEIEADFDMSGVMAAEGGRIGFAEGPKNPKRRLFLKIMGGIASLPIFPSFLKKTEEAAQVIKPLKGTTTVMPDWFPNFVQQIMFKSPGKKIDADLMEYTVKELPDIRILRHDDGRVFVEGKNEYGKSYSIEYEPPGYELYDEQTGKAFKKSGDFVAEEEVPINMDPDGNVDFDGVVLDSVDDILGSDARRMEEFTTGKPAIEKKGELEVQRAEGAYESAKEDYYYDEID